jgi:cytochrome b
VLLILIAWRTAETRDLSTHILAGSGIIGLLVFRLWWGLFGASTARFTSFVKGPGTVLSYARSLKHAAPEPGHNPMGGWSVAGLLVCLIALTGFGLIADDVDALNPGPFSDKVDYDTSRLASHLHAWSFDVLEVLVLLHLAAMLFYALFKRLNLVGAMVTGRQAKLAGHNDIEPGSLPMLAIGLSLGLAVTLYLAHLSGSL